MWRVDEGVQSPSWKGLKGVGIPPHPPLFEGTNGVNGKAHDPGYKRLEWCRTHFVCSWSFKMADFPYYRMTCY